MSEHTPAFKRLRTHYLSHLKLEFQEYEHVQTGIRHIHLACASEEKVFMAAFRTMPMNSTGVAHVLEHTVLCGSDRFPVRDPFFMMIRRSLNTFMNAMTSGDWTAYPFATLNNKDFYNLLSVYLDAVFHPVLDPLDFAQEGIRVELAHPETPETSPLVFKGVVFNEMKGAMSSAISQLYEGMNRYLFPTTTYHFNSGGDPLFIQDLTHADLLAFHARHYHPGNGLFLSFGDIDIAVLQERLQKDALAGFSDRGDRVFGRNEKRYLAPMAVEECYPLDEAESQAKTHIVLGWLLGNGSDLEHGLCMTLLSGVLFNHAASPLRLALESSDLATSASPLCGTHDSSRELVFMAGVEGSEPERAQAVEQLVFEVLEKIANEGVDPEDAESILHQIELHEREIGGDRYPYGLSLLMTLLSPTLQDVDPLPLLDWSEALERLRTKIQDRFYLAGQIRQWLLQNPHRVRLTLRPDSGMSAAARRQETEALQLRTAMLTEADRQQLLQQMQALQERQSQEDKGDCLPKVGRADIPPALANDPQVEQHSFASGLQLNYGYAGTNGLVYMKLCIDQPLLEESLLPWLPLYRDVVTELGAGTATYQDRQRRQAAVTGGVSLSELAFSGLGQTQNAYGRLVLSGKALKRHQPALAEFMIEQLEQLRLDESERIHELLQQMRLRWDHSVSQDGHQLAMGRASTGMSTLANWRVRQRGLPGLQFLREQDRRLTQEPGFITDIQGYLQRIHQAVLQQRRVLLWAGEQEAHAGLWDSIGHWSVPEHSVSGGLLPCLTATMPTAEAWLTQTQVYFCVQSFSAAPLGHPDDAALRLLGPIMRNRYLHAALRERGGAYGGGALYVGDEAAFHLYSYRDPRFEGTYADFAAAITEVTEHKPTWEQLEEALLNIISQMDKPVSPAGDVMQVLVGQMTLRHRAVREQFRRQLLSTTPEDIQRVAQTYLNPAQARKVVVMPLDAQSRASDMGMHIEYLK